MSYPTIDFTGNCGENSSASSPVGLAPNQIMSINGNTDMSGCAIANDGGRVYGVKLVSNPGLFDYSVQVDAQGPKGLGSGNMYLAFTDASGDTYRLSIFSSNRSTHTVAYNSKLPNIMRFQWNNHSIST